MWKQIWPSCHCIKWIRRKRGHAHPETYENMTGCWNYALSPVVAAQILIPSVKGLWKTVENYRFRTHILLRIAHSLPGTGTGPGSDGMQASLNSENCLDRTRLLLFLAYPFQRRHDQADISQNSGAADQCQLKSVKQHRDLDVRGLLYTRR